MLWSSFGKSIVFFPWKELQSATTSGRCWWTVPGWSWTTIARLKYPSRNLETASDRTNYQEKTMIYGGILVFHVLYTNWLKRRQAADELLDLVRFSKAAALEPVATPRWFQGLHADHFWGEQTNPSEFSVSCEADQNLTKRPQSFVSNAGSTASSNLSISILLIQLF